MKRFAPLRKGFVLAAALITLSGTAWSLEPRIWISLDGKQLEATLVRKLNDNVELLDKEGRTLKVPLVQLSFGDQEYVKDNLPEDTKAPSQLGSKPTGKVKLPNPAKEMKSPNKAFNKDAGVMDVKDEAFKICETPHFKILYLRPADPIPMAELAERLWHDTAFFHGSFAGKWKDRKMAVFMVNTNEGYNGVGEWYATLLDNAGNKDEADRTRAVWERTSSAGLNLPQDVAEKYGLITDARVFRTFQQDSRGNQIQIKDLWNPFRTHCLAGDLLGVQAGGVSGFSKEGAFAIFTGFAYFKEIALTGESGTALVRASGTEKAVDSVGGYKDGKNWPGELKKRIKKGTVAPLMDKLWRADRDTADEDTNALSYAFSRFLQSSQERLAYFGKLIERINTSHQVPAPDEVAKMFGYDSVAAMEKAWGEWMDSGEFR